jgi:hypothetical protein
MTDNPSAPILIHWSPGRVQGLGPTPPSCTNWDMDERQTLVTDWACVTCSECLRDRRKIERMWGDG